MGCFSDFSTFKTFSDVYNYKDVNKGTHPIKKKYSIMCSLLKSIHN